MLLFGTTVLIRSVSPHTAALILQHRSTNVHNLGLTLDYGVSYALAGIQGVLVYLITKPWRYVYLTALLFFFGLGVVQSRDFTSIGHFTSVLLGLACYPLTRARPGSWDPVASTRDGLHRLRDARRPQPGG